LTIEEKIQALTQAIRTAKTSSEPIALPHWEDDVLLAPLTSALQDWMRQSTVIRMREVEAQRDLYEAIFNQIPADVVIIDQNFRYLFISEFAVKDPQVRAWLIGKDDFEYCAFRGLDNGVAVSRQASLLEAMATRKTVKFTEVRTDRAGVTQHKFRMLSPVLNPQGEPFLFVGHGMDVTELVAKEKSLQEKNDILEKVNHELDQFVYRASHDLRAPLSSVQGLLEIVHQSELPQDAAHYLTLMSRAIAKMDGFIRDIVDHSKNSRQELTIEEIDLQKEIEDVLQQLAFLKGAEKVDVRIQLQLEAPLYTDRFRLRVVLNNLISNSVKYQDPEKANPFVEIQAQVTAEQSRITVRDNGIGIDPKHLPHVTEMFYRATNAATGTGIGLYIVQEVALKLGGSVRMQSDIGKGTEVVLSFSNAVHPAADRPVG
jgi:signal transduction histidine kinase